jgi:hypothetical protein
VYERRVGVGGQDDECHRGLVVAQPREHVEAAATGHLQVDQREHRIMLEDQQLGRRSVGRLTDDVEARVLVERPDDAGPEQRMIVGDDDRERRPVGHHSSAR